MVPGPKTGKDVEHSLYVLGKAPASMVPGPKTGKDASVTANNAHALNASMVPGPKTGKDPGALAPDRRGDGGFNGARSEDRERSQP